MLTLAYCRDSHSAKAARERCYDAHIQYLGSVRDQIRFAGPLASVDDARVLGDERLMGSLFVLSLAMPGVQAALASDPYAQGGVWESVDLFDVTDATGPWLAEPAAAPGGRLYVALSRRTPVEPPGSGLLFSARLRRVGFVGKAGAESWCEVVFFATAAMSVARAFLGLAPTSSPNATHPWEVWAVPLSVGSWTRRLRKGDTT